MDADITALGVTIIWNYYGITILCNYYGVAGYQTSLSTEISKLVNLSQSMVLSDIGTGNP